MQKITIKKISLFAAVLIFLLCAAQTEYDGFKLSQFVHPILWFSIPFIVKFVFPINSSIIKTYVVTAGKIAYVAITIFFAFSSIICRWSRDVPVYKHRYNNYAEIVCRTYDCYGTAENCRLYKVYKLTEHLNWVTKISKAKIDSTVWEVIPFN